MEKSYITYTLEGLRTVTSDRLQEDKGGDDPLFPPSQIWGTIAALLVKACVGVSQ